MRCHIPAVCSLFLGLCLAAHADPVTFTLNFSSADYTGSATLTGVADPFSTGAYDITSGSITINGSAASLVPGGNTGNTLFLSTPGTTLYYDNALYTNANPVDGSGLLFLLGQQYINLFYDTATTGYSLLYANANNATYGKEDVYLCADVAATPEPSSLLLLATGLVAAFLAMQHRRKLA